MITGVIKADEARIRLTVRGRSGHEQEIEALFGVATHSAVTDLLLGQLFDKFLFGFITCFFVGI